MANVLVTGGAGYIGSVCCERLLNAGHRVSVVDDLSTGHAEAVPTGAELNVLSLSNRPEMARLLARGQFDVVFHFAAKALISESVTNPGVFFDRNVAAGVALLEVLRAAGIKHFVFSSTAAVYGNPRQVPIPEDHPKEPVNAYGESKLALERMLQWYASAYGWTVVAFRYFNACGATAQRGERHEPETHIIPLLLQVASGRRSSFQIFGGDYATPDGTCLRDYVHVIDIADAHLLALRKFDPGFHAYNIGTGTSHSVREIAAAVEKLLNRKLHFQVAARRAGDPAVLCASPQRLQDELNWSPQHSSIENILASAWQWELKRASRVASPGPLAPRADYVKVQDSH